MTTAPAKPRMGQPCNGCGLCCAAEPCAIAVVELGAQKGPCPAMEFDDGRFNCGMVTRPNHYLGIRDKKANEVLSPIFANALGIGKGCDSDA